MELELPKLPRRDIYAHMVRLILPRPIAWVSTQSPDGVVNLAPFSYFNAVGSNPPTLMFCPANRPDGTKKDTLKNIELTGEFVVNVVSERVAQAMVNTSMDFDAEISELESCGLTAVPSAMVSPPRVAEAHAHFECTLHTVLHLGTGPAGANMVIGNIKTIHVDDDVLDEHGFADPEKLSAVGRLGGASYCKTGDRFDLKPEK